MALTCPVDFDTVTLRAEIQTMYSRVATMPDGHFHFHRGPEYAATRLGYDSAELAALPPSVTSSFAGVGNPHAIAPIHDRGPSSSTSAAAPVRICCLPHGTLVPRAAQLAST